MTNNQTIKFTIKQDGTVHEEVQGVVGDECETLTREIEQALGEISGRKHKPEYYKNNVTLQHNQDINQEQTTTD